MSKLLKLSFALFFLIFAPACASSHTIVDSEVMINMLLHIDSEKFMSKTSNGKPFYNSLLEYKEWSHSTSNILSMILTIKT